jgi:hypothetical protein
MVALRATAGTGDFLILETATRKLTRRMHRPDAPN